MIKTFYRIVAKAVKSTSYIELASLLGNDVLCKVWLPKVLSMIESINIIEESFSNPPLVMPILSEALFILNKLFEGIIKMNIKILSRSAYSENCKNLSDCAESIGNAIVDKSLAIMSLAEGEAFKDTVDGALLRMLLIIQ